jgi:hypothetical protein
LSPIKGRKRHIAVDTEGNLLAVIVHSAGIQDRVAARADGTHARARVEAGDTSTSRTHSLGGAAFAPTSRW